jgi:UTP--glucose-1-phosphate uridylyltransferase
VIQVETAMGSAVEVFTGAVALEVERDRFLPVKSTNDLLGLRSDVYVLGADYRLRLAEDVREAPYVDLDDAHYKLIRDFDARFPEGAPSLVGATSLMVHGDWTFESDVVVRGAVELGADGSPGRVASGTVLSG